MAKLQPVERAGGGAFQHLIRECPHAASALACSSHTTCTAAQGLLQQQSFDFTSSRWRHCQKTALPSSCLAANRQPLPPATYSLTRSRSWHHSLHKCCNSTPPCPHPPDTHVEATHRTWPLPHPLGLVPQEGISILSRPTASDTELLAALQALQVLVEPIDNANGGARGAGLPGLGPWGSGLGSRGLRVKTQSCRTGWWSPSTTPTVGTVETGA